MASDHELGGGVWRVVSNAGAETVEVRDLDAFRRALGEGLAVGFAMLFTAVDRVTAFTYLQTVNARPVARDFFFDAHHPASAAASKARLALLLHTWGVLYELHPAIRVLQCAGATLALTKPKKLQQGLRAWRSLRTASGRWRERIPMTARNQLAFHLGDTQAYIKGLADWPRGESLPISTSDRGLVGVQFHLGFRLLCRGLDLSDEDLDRHAHQATEDAEEIRDNAIAMFVAVMRNRGVDLPTRPEGTK